MDIPPAPGTPYSMWPGNPPRFEVVRVVQEHPEYWVLELQSIFASRLRVQAVILREAAAVAARVRRAS